ncbi:3-oxoacyl-[acyl-carrier protein] reductase [Paenibacillus sp. UNCCL117]|uniref:SDR family NAD(P)-dependent oxidoreductase n=1 Tax=unclassified Paenibacillus TaxID=185978 RepID=UPI000889DF60|nr:MULTISPECIES: SDR family NAD(P)-dependent oxidoreductase [unclassified Paenibacillus]SDE55530.1 3-oxoacyl-[acyl-carrier protein] reductase [Paenibacillus sp. cl123]SFW66418.1 3-oxoacyl-[acyl-carrier protein] reductase [Paenibacillus sp. UNCCL117]
MLLAGRKALITGAAGNLGRAIAERFAAEGCAVWIADLNGPAAAAAAESLNRRGYRAEAVVMDVTDEESVKQAFAAIDALDILVNNAGRTRGGFVEHVSLQEWNDILNVNLTSVFLCSKYAMPLLSRSEAPAIVSISSINALRVNPGFPAYAAAKRGILALTEQLAIEGAQYRIRANCVSPGWTPSEAKQRERENDAGFNIDRDCYPLGRLGLPEDVANAVLFLASDLSAFVNGVNLPVDGGMTLLATTGLIRPDLRKRWRKGVYKLEAEE